MNQSPKNTATKLRGSVFLDANVLLEIILNRSRANACRQLLTEYKGVPAISALTAHLVIHFGQAIVELPVLRQFLGDYSVLSLQAVDFEWAFTNTISKDYEDGLQLAVAIRSGYDEFVTLDKSLAGHYSGKVPLRLHLIH